MDLLSRDEQSADTAAGVFENTTEAFLLGFSEACSLALLVVDQSGRIAFANQSVLTLLGYGRDDLIRQPIDIIIPERFRGSHTAGFSRVIAGGETHLVGRTVEVPARRADGSEVPVDLTLSVWSQGGQTYVGAILRDITERRERNRRLMHQANTDALTGLANRKHFLECVGSALETGRPALVAVINIRGFRNINDSLGSAIGDALLQAVAIRLPYALPAETVVARLAGDVFALVYDLPDPTTEPAVAKYLLDIFVQPFEIAGCVFQVDIHLGTAIAPLDAADAEELLAAAELAMTAARTERQLHWRSFQPTMRAAEAEKRAKSDAVLRAFHLGQLCLHYQPQIALATGRMIGVEALIRWQHPERGLLLPGVFLPAIHGTALELPIGWWTLEAACRQIAAWQSTALEGVRVGVNLFPTQFLSGMLVSRVETALARYGIPPHLLELEVTEVVSLKEDDVTRRQFEQLRALGVRIALDDFGTGYASLSSLNRFPLTTLKIDRSFVKDLSSTAHGATITRAMLAMARELGLETVAEGVETDAQRALLTALGCDVGQGFLYSPAVMAETLSGATNAAAVA